MLKIGDTARLRYVSGETEYEALFKDIQHAKDLVTDIMDELEPMSAEERRAALQRSIERLEADVRFITTHVVPKEADPNVREIVYAENLAGVPVGRVAINNTTAEHPTIDVRVRRDWQRQGYGYEMLRAVVAAAFDQLGLDHLEYDVLTSNGPSLALIHKLGGVRTYADGVGEMYELRP